MSVFVCPKCGETTKIFAHDDSASAFESKAQEMNIDYLGDIPLDAGICRDADNGRPTIISEEANGQLKNTRFYEDIALKLAGKLALPWT